METLEPILAQHPFFEALDSGVSETARRMCVQCALRSRDIHLSPRRGGQPVLSASPGKSRARGLRAAAPADHHRDPGERRRSGLVLGGAHRTHWRLDARAVEPTRAIALDGKCLRNKCEENHDLGYELLKRFVHIVEQRLEATRLQLLDVYAPHR